jgi:NTE family protein
MGPDVILRGNAHRTLRHAEVLKRPSNHEGAFTFDLDADGRE